MRRLKFLLIVGLFLGTASVLALRSAPGARAEPRLTEAQPADGAVLQGVPEALHLCFTDAVKLNDPSDWKFSVKTPDGTPLGLRIVFQTDGRCVDVHPGTPTNPPNGIWNFSWLVHAQSDGSEGSGLIRFQLGELRPGETPLPATPVPRQSTAGDGSSDDTTTFLFIALAVGTAIVLLGGSGFFLARRRR